MSLAVEVQNPNRWTAREFPVLQLLDALPSTPPLLILKVFISLLKFHLCSYMLANVSIKAFHVLIIVIFNSLSHSSSIWIISKSCPVD